MIDLASDFEKIKKAVCTLRKEAEALAKEKNIAIYDIDMINNPSELRYRLISLRTIVDDQIVVYRSLSRNLAKMRRFQRRYRLHQINKWGGIFSDLIEWEHDLGIFLGFLLRSLKRQRRALKSTSSAYSWVVGVIFSLKKKIPKSDIFQKCFRTFYSYYETELVLEEKFKRKLVQIEKESVARISLFKKMQVIYDDKRIVTILDQARNAEKKGNKDALAILAKQFDSIIEYEVKDKRLAKMMYINIKWTLRKVAPITMFSPIPGTNVGILGTVLVLTVVQFVGSIAVERARLKRV